MRLSRKHRRGGPMDGIIDQVRRMPLADRRGGWPRPRGRPAEELASGEAGPDRCPMCGCPAFVREGPRRGRPPEVAVPGWPGLRRRHARAARRSKLPAAAWMGVRGLHGRPRCRCARRRPGWGVAVHGVVRGMRVCEVMGRRLLPARGESSRWTARTSGVDAGQPPAAGSAWGPAHQIQSHDASRAGLGGSVCVLCGVSETGDCFCELADGAEDRPGWRSSR